jgi:hypothetical protein
VSGNALSFLIENLLAVFLEERPVEIRQDLSQFSIWCG